MELGPVQSVHIRIQHIIENTQGAGLSGLSSALGSSSGCSACNLILMPGIGMCIFISIKYFLYLWEVRWWLDIVQCLDLVSNIDCWSKIENIGVAEKEEILCD